MFNLKPVEFFDGRTSQADGTRIAIIYEGKDVPTKESLHTKGHNYLRRYYRARNHHLTDVNSFCLCLNTTVKSNGKLEETPSECNMYIIPMKNGAMACNSWAEFPLSKDIRPYFLREKDIQYLLNRFNATHTTREILTAVGYANNY